jgi:hypothetical protein
MPKKKLPATLKLSFQEKGGYQLIDKGKPVQPVRFMEAVQFFVEQFFSEPLPQRLEELSRSLEKKGETDLAQSFRNIKAKIEEYENPVPPHQSNLTEWNNEVDRLTESRFLRAITAMLSQFMAESLLGRSGEPVDLSRFMRQVAGIGDNPKTIRKAIERVRYCVRDKALSDFLGVRVGGVRDENKNPDWTEEHKAAFARLDGEWGAKLDQLVDCVISIIKTNNYDANSLSIVKARTEFQELERQLVISDKDDKIFQPALAALVEDVFEGRSRRKPRYLSPEGLKLRFKARLINASASLPSLATLKRYRTQGSSSNNMNI